MIHTVTPQRSAGEAMPPPGHDPLPGPIEWTPLPDSLAGPLLSPEDVVAEAETVDDAAEEFPPPAVPAAEMIGAPHSGVFHAEAIAASLPRLPVTVHSLGPVGCRRSATLAVILGILTLGLYPVAWIARANREMADFDPRMVVRSSRTALALFIPVLLGLGIGIVAAARIVAGHMGYNYDLPVSYHDTRWFLLAPLAIAPLTALLPFSAVAAAMTAERVRVVEDRSGVDPENQVRPAVSLPILVIPLVGVAVFVARAQRRLNRVWATSVGPGGLPYTVLTRRITVESARTDRNTSDSLTCRSPSPASPEREVWARPPPPSTSPPLSPSAASGCSSSTAIRSPTSPAGSASTPISCRPRFAM
jgi:hypothetical protein